MEAGFVVMLVGVALVMGIVIGLLIVKLIKRSEKTQGTIYAYCNNQVDQPALLLEYNVPIDDITSRKRVLFDGVIIH